MTYEFENPYGPNVLQFEGDEQQGSGSTNEKSYKAVNEWEKKKKQWVSTLHQELLKGLNLPLRVHLMGNKLFGE